MGKHAKLVNFSRCAAQLVSCAVITAIINIDNFKRAALIDSDNFVNQRPDVASLVHHRNENRNLDLRSGKPVGLGLGHEDEPERYSGTCVSLALGAGRVKSVGAIQED